MERHAMTTPVAPTRTTTPIPRAPAPPPGGFHPPALAPPPRRRPSVRLIVIAVLAFSLGSCTAAAIEGGQARDAEQRATRAQDRAGRAQDALQAMTIDVEQRAADAADALTTAEEARAAAERLLSGKDAELVAARSIIEDLQDRLDDAAAVEARPKAAVTAPAEEPTEVISDETTSTYYDNCSAARADGAAPVRTGDPGYGRHLDRDGDGVGCE